LDELAAERSKLLEMESAELQQQAESLANEIKELSGEGTSRIVQPFARLATDNQNS
jgi:hypothetical protein